MLECCHRSIFIEFPCHLVAFRATTPPPVATRFPTPRGAILRHWPHSPTPDGEHLQSRSRPGRLPSGVRPSCKVPLAVKMANWQQRRIACPLIGRAHAQFNHLLGQRAVCHGFMGTAQLPKIIPHRCSQQRGRRAHKQFVIIPTCSLTKRTETRHLAASSTSIQSRCDLASFINKHDGEGRQIQHLDCFSGSA